MGAEKRAQVRFAVTHHVAEGVVQDFLYHAFGRKFNHTHTADLVRMRKNFRALPLIFCNQSHGPTILTISNFPPLPARHVRMGPGRQVRPVMPAESFRQPAVHVLGAAQAVFVVRVARVPGLKQTVVRAVSESTVTLTPQGHKVLGAAGFPQG